MAAKIEFLMTTSGVFLSDLPCSFFSVLYRKTPRALWSYLRDSIFELFLSAAPMWSVEPALAAGFMQKLPSTKTHDRRPSKTV